MVLEKIQLQLQFVGQDTGSRVQVQVKRFVTQASVNNWQCQLEAILLGCLTCLGAYLTQHPCQRP